MKNPWVVIAVVAIVLFGGAIWYSGLSAEQNNQGVEIKQHIKGNPEAAVKLMEFSDFQCPACAAFQPFLEEVMTNYGDQIAFEFKHFPLPMHRMSLSAAVAAEAAGQQGKFFEYHDLLFKNQQTWSASAAPAAFFVKYAEELGLDTNLFKRQMNSSQLRDKVKGEFAEGESKGVTGTPTFFLNGQKMEFNSYLEFLQQIVAVIDPVAAAAMASSTGDTLSPPPGVKFGI